MSTATPATDPRVIDAPERIPDWSEWDSARGAVVKKIVIGQLGDEAKKNPLALGPLPHDFALRFPSLTHLYLWNCKEFVALPALPTSLECLDVRGCRELTLLPALPSTLETLDLGGCESLAELSPARLPKLARFYCDDCSLLPADDLGSFLKALRKANAPLVEIDGSGVPAVTSLERFVFPTLRRLVLKGCTRLNDASMIADFTGLDHLNLAGCTALASLPDLPPKLRYLELFGASALREFMGQSLASYDLGTKDGLRQNVAKEFKTRKKYGRDLAIMPHAKLMMMGDGRVGKTTLAKRLQWDELSPAEQAAPEAVERRPRPDEPYTHKVQFSAWATGLKLSGSRQTELEAGAKRAALTIPRTAKGELAGTIRIWDFGGQEIYHSTHRVFAGEGSVFLVVWRAKEVPPGPKPAAVDESEWKEWNQQRTLDYWFDYIQSLRPHDLRLALVCTGCGGSSDRPQWRSEKRAPKYLSRLDFSPPEFYIDSLDWTSESENQMKRLVAWIRTACGDEASRIGILQPTFYCQVAAKVTGWLEENKLARERAEMPRHLICAWNEWVNVFRDVHRGIAPTGAGELSDDDVVSVTNYLHNSGHVFSLGGGRVGSSVLVDQQWATDLIYRLLKPGLDGDRVLWNRVRRNGGWFYGQDLESDEVWAGLPSDDLRNRLLAYMEECNVITQIGRAEERTNLFCRNIYLASDKWLLPTFAEVRAKVDAAFTVVSAQAGYGVHERFQFEEFNVSEFEFRKMQSTLARRFGTRAIYFRNGLQAVAEPALPEIGWCVRVRWLPLSEEREASPATKQTPIDPFLGRIVAVLTAPRERLEQAAAELEEVLCPETSRREAGLRARAKRSEPHEIDLSPEFFGPAGAAHYPVAISSSGQDKEAATLACAALKGNGLKVLWYCNPETDPADMGGLLEFMNRLNRTPVIVLVLSDGYLRPNRLNWYCAIELADAVCQLAEDRRTVAQSIAVYQPGGTLDAMNLPERMAELFQFMEQQFDQLYMAKPPRLRENFEEWDRIRKRFTSALKDDRIGRFFAARGTLGTFLALPADPQTPGAFDPLVAAVRAALR